MEPNEQAVQLIDRLLELTRNNKVEWQETVENNTFLAAFPKYVVTIGKSEDAYRFGVADEFGKTLEDVAFAKSENRYLSEDFEQLHSLARRHALHSDAAISELLSSLATIR